jgi:hypothetical protein
MNSNDNTFQRAVSRLLTEVFDGPSAQEAYILNPGDSGLHKQLEQISAAAASKQPIPGKPSIAAHVDHVQYGLSLLTRWLSGEENPWAEADWNGSWQRITVDDEQWRRLRDNLRRDSEIWRSAVVKRSEWDDISAAGALSTIAHTAYHLGAIRQILAAAG